MHTYTQKTRMLVTMIACAATAGIASTAQAGDAGESSARYDSVVVKYSDLDLDSAAGTKALFARLSAAAERACGNAPNARDLQRQAQFRACYDQRAEQGGRQDRQPRVAGAARVGRCGPRGLSEPQSHRFGAGSQGRDPPCLDGVNRRCAPPEIPS